MRKFIQQQAGDVAMSQVSEHVGAAIASDDLLARLEGDLDNAAEAFAKGRLCLIIGAGASVPAGAGSGSNIAEEALRTRILPASVYVVDDWRSLHRPFEVTMAVLKDVIGLGLEGLESYVRDSLYDGDTDAPAAYGELSALLSMSEGDLVVPTKRIFTTNYDTFIEEVVGDSCKTVTIKNLPKLSAIEAIRNSTTVVHFHGAVKRETDNVSAGTLVATEEDMFDGSGSRQMMTARLVESMVGADVVAFVGYSMTDANLRAIFYEFRSLLAELGRERRPLFVNPYDDKAKFALDSKIAVTRQGHLVPLEASTFFRLLRQRIEAKGNESNLQRLAEHRTESMEELLTQIELVQTDLNLSREQAVDFLMRSPNHNGDHLPDIEKLNQDVQD